MEKACRCPAIAIEHYRARLSGPFLDRIDALIEVPPLTLSALDEGNGGEPSASVRARVTAAQSFRQERAAGGDAAPQAIEERNHLTREGRALLRQALVREGLSGRAYVRIIALARTIADLDNVLAVGSEHIAEALALRLDHRRIGFS